MRIVSVIAEMGSGGAETVVADLSEHLRSTATDVWVASSGGWRADRLAAAGVPTLDVPLRSASPRALLRSAQVLRRATAARPVDLVHAHNVRATAAAHLGTRWGRRRPPALVTTVHGLAEADYRRAARVLGVCDLVVAVSADVAARIEDGGVDPARVRIVENAVPAPAPVSGAEARAVLGLPDDVPLTVCVARLSPPKRVDLLLDAWPEVPGVLLVVGDGPERPALERRAAPHADRVRFLGERDDVGRWLAAADVLALPTDREGLPMVVLEAMAARVPVVASAVGGLLDLEPGVVELVAPGRPAELASALRRLHADGERRTALAGAAAALVQDRYSAERMRSAYDAVYAEARAMRPGAGTGVTDGTDRR